MGLYQDILTQPVSALDLREVVQVTPDQSIKDAIREMREHRLGFVVCVDEAGKQLGCFTERHLIKMLLTSTDLDEKLGDHVMSVAAIVRESDPISKVVEAMLLGDERFVLVVDQDDRPIALTGQRGVVEFVTEHLPRQIKVQVMDSKLHQDTREGA